MPKSRKIKIGWLDPEISQRIGEVLRQDPDFIVPVKKLYKHFLRGLALPPYEEFLAEIKASPDLVTVDLGEDDADDWDEAEMEALGYYNGPRVRLRDRVPTPADMAEILKRHTDKMMESLGQAYCLGTEHFTDEEEDAMLALLKRAGNLKKSVDQLIKVPAKKRKAKGGGGKKR